MFNLFGLLSCPGNFIRIYSPLPLPGSLASVIRISRDKEPWEKCIVSLFLFLESYVFKLIRHPEGMDSPADLVGTSIKTSSGPT